jgi:hypothetical protein
MKKNTIDYWIEMSIREIWTQSHFAGIAYSHIYPKTVRGTDLVFSSIHSFLSHAAMVSKMLLAKSDDSVSKSIGDILGIPPTSLVHNRKFRNHLEHYDERLKQWIKKAVMGRAIGTYNVGPKSMIGIPNMIFVSHYDPTNDTFTFVDEDFNLGELNTELVKINVLADEWVKKMEREIIKPPFI